MHPRYALPFLAALALPLAARAGGDMIVTTPAGPPTLSFDDKGAQVGEQLPDLPVVSIDNEPLHLSDRARGPLTLIVTSSFTCPKSRANYPTLADLAEKYKGKINVSILYVIEAHPAGDISPYRGKEDITPENTRDGILRRQPTTLDKRLTLANDFVTRMGGPNPRIPLMVDTMDNWAWKSVGAGPNMAILVDTNRTVIARQGWFNANTLAPLLDKALAEAKPAAAPDAVDPLMKQLLANKEIDDSLFGFITLVDDEHHGQLAALLKAHPKLALAPTPYSPRGDIGGETLLQLATRQNAPAAVNLLLAAGADPARSTPRRTSALHLAAELGHDDLLKLLLPKVPNPDVRSNHGPTPLELALLHVHPATATILTTAGAKESFFTHMARGDADVVQSALAKDPSLAARTDGADNSPLAYAAANGQIAILRQLTAAGPALASLDGNGSALALAIQHNHPDALYLLLAAGADPNARDGLATTILHRAVNEINPALVEPLLAAGANPNTSDAIGRSPLHLAAGQGDVPTLKLLLAAGAKINAQSGDVTLPCGPGGPTARLLTPLHSAVIENKPATVAALLAANANPNLEDNEGLTPLDYAEKSNHPALKKLLTDAGAKKGSGQKHDPSQTPPPTGL